MSNSARRKFYKGVQMMLEAEKELSTGKKRKKRTTSNSKKRGTGTFGKKRTTSTSKKRGTGTFGKKRTTSTSKKRGTGFKKSNSKKGFSSAKKRGRR